MTTRHARTNATKGRFGTFGGVFTPNVLTILGIILFLRTGWVVGQAGLYNALIIVLIANGISLLTGLSLSAIATSMEVRTGGNYYIISRSLGLEIGGAIGIPLYLSQAISVAFYVIGFTEALLSSGVVQADPQRIATMVVLLFGVVAYIGADFALKIQFVILAILVSALLSFFTGGWGEIARPVTDAQFTPDVTFWTVFAVFFPAVTGIEVGTSMSGDLKEPGRSIPLGTIASILVTALVYVAAVIWFATHATPDELIGDTLIMQRIARFPFLILAGVFAATLSSALGSIVAAPRTLQAIAVDHVVPHWMGSQMGSATEPRMGVLLTTTVAVGVIWMGDLNAVAPVITMFFLNTYGMTNLVATIERLVGNPSFRPQFHIPWGVSLAGALGCYGAMFLINPLATLVAIVVSYGIYFYLRQRTLAATWGDVRSGIWFTLARFALLKLDDAQAHPKNWRPNILVFTGQPHNREPLVRLADWLSLGQGLVTFSQLLVGDVSQLADRGMRRTARRHIQAYIRERGMAAFAEADVVATFEQGAVTVSQAHGIGSLEPNTVLLGWSGTASGRATSMALLRTLTQLHKSVLFLNHDPVQGFGRQQVIDVWWGGHGGNGSLMLILTHLIRRHMEWDGARVRLLRVIGGEEGREQTRTHMERLLRAVRVEAEPVIIVRSRPGQPISEIAMEWSRGADLTLLGMKVPDEAELVPYSEALHEMVERIGSVVLVRSTQTTEILEAGA